MTRSAVIFDLDGTLTHPYLDFGTIRAEMGITGPILEALAQMHPADRLRAEEVLTKHEHAAAESATLQEGAEAVIRWCRERGHPIAILTRNARATVDIVLGKFALEVDALRTRDDGEIKPSPQPVFSICEQVDADPKRSWLIGDHPFDIECGRSAGTKTVLMISDNPQPDSAGRADFVIRRLTELPAIIEPVGQVNDLP